MNRKRILQFFALIATLALLVSLVWLMTQKNSPFYQPMQSYDLLTPLNQVTQVEIDEVVKPYLGLSFWEIPLSKIQADLTRLDWVNQAEVKRQWPNTLYISIQEQKPIARWNDNGLINAQGEVFFPNEFSEYEDLVSLQSELKDSTQVLQQLIAWQAKFDQLNLVIARLAFFNQVWRIEILDGPEIVVDSSAKEEKMQRFVKAFPKLDERLRKSATSYDLRYSNGFIVANSETP